ncbi:hypothetical protein DPMN_140971 [Dreissena polymorpha]|uniref:Uncharacterized protein n=1 Tax=Dreissena polymorpha TaxID=45954 RepID=A0A9D4G8J3_DREPO|nr:hypothetical protein DPMN_140971 [Dreissena polymorpha]
MLSANIIASSIYVVRYNDSTSAIMLLVWREIVKFSSHRLVTYAATTDICHVTSIFYRNASRAYPFPLSLPVPTKLTRSHYLPVPTKLTRSHYIELRVFK